MGTKRNQSDDDNVAGERQNECGGQGGGGRYGAEPDSRSAEKRATGPNDRLVSRIDHLNFITEADEALICGP